MSRLPGFGAARSPGSAVVQTSLSAPIIEFPSRSEIRSCIVALSTRLANSISGGLSTETGTMTTILEGWIQIFRRFTAQR